MWLVMTAAFFHINKGECQERFSENITLNCIELFFTQSKYGFRRAPLFVLLWCFIVYSCGRVFSKLNVCSTEEIKVFTGIKHWCVQMMKNFPYTNQLIPYTITLKSIF